VIYGVHADDFTLGDMHIPTYIAALLAIFAAVLALGGLWWWFVGRNAPKYPPLNIADDDPAMLAAYVKARASLARFRELFGGGMKECQVKVPFVTNSGEREHLWGEVLKLGDTSITVRYLTPPVSHSGKLERVHEHSISDVEDWVAITQTGEIHGGYTQRVMFERARELWGVLPRELDEQASKYVAHSEVRP
jgi:uncharacterized protein YegJ (DUF2314 family)